MNSCRSCLICALLLVMTTMVARSEPLPFRRAMQLAAEHGAASVASADVERARAGYRETRSMFLPQLVVGSGLAKTYGFPLSIEGAAPTAVNVNYQSYLINVAQMDLMRSAKEEWKATAATAQEQRNASLLEAAITYIQLDTMKTRADVLREQQSNAQRMVTVVEDRVRAGVDSQVSLTRAKLVAAQVRMRLADAEGAADVLRERLGQLTGLSPSGIETVPESIPEVPDLSQDTNLVANVLESSPAVKAAEQQALAKELRARGEHKMMYPAVDAVAQYGRFSKYNNYDQYFSHFQHNNATVGVAIRFPFLSYPQRAAAEAADAEAVKARRQTVVTKDQVSAETVKLSRSVRQLSAAGQVAQLDYQLALDQSEALEARMKAAAPGGPTGPAPGPVDLQAAKIQAHDKYSTYLDTNFELRKAELQLLRATGKLESWALENR